MLVRPQNWTATTAPAAPSKAEVDAKKAQVVARIKAVVNANGKPMDSFDIAKQLVEKEHFFEPYLNFEELCTSVEKEWHPTDDKSPLEVGLGGEEEVKP